MGFYQIHKVAKSIGSTEILRDICFQLEEGERIGLVGVNGCGKTTLLRILAGLDKPDRGSIMMPKHATAGMMQQQDPTGDALSGGEKTWSALTRLLADPPDLVLLDEPTNNLDLQSIRNTIKLLRNCLKTLIIVSHDRFLLDSLVTRILEIEDGRIVEYAGNYTFYRQEKQRLYDARLHRYQAARKEQMRIMTAIRQTRQWAQKAHHDSTEKDRSGNKMGTKEYHRAKAMKMEKKAKNDIRRLKRMAKTSEPKPVPEKSVHFEITGEARHGRRVLEAAGLAKSFNEKILFEISDFYILRNEKVAVFGPNGCGKTTLVHMIQNLETPDSGRLWLSQNIEPHVLTQQIDDMAGNISVLSWLTGRVGHLDGLARAQLAQMGILSRHLNQALDSTSQGEKMKLKLAEPILTGQEFLILDEPTNYLDLHAREMLEDALSDYQGTLLVISHDLYLLKNICNKVLLFENNRILRLEYSFAEYIARFVDKDTLHPAI